MAIELRRTTGGRWSRRRALAGAASVVAATALAAAIVGRGCQMSSTRPQDVVRQFAAAARAGDYDTVYGLLGPVTRAQLESASRRATDLVGSSRRYSAVEMISIGTTDSAPLQQVAVRERSDSHAIVEIIRSNGERARLNLVRVATDWRIEIPQYAAKP